MKGSWLVLTTLSIILSGCYEPLGELCHPSDPGCAGCAGRVCGLSPDGQEDCGTCEGSTEWCNDLGQCQDDCAGLQCGSSPNQQFDCGDCPPDFICTSAGVCEEVCPNPCADDHCPGPGECCVAADCGTGNWSCNQDHKCVCPGQVCDDDSCTAADGCCQDVVDDETCGPGAICQDGLCQAGPAGELIITGVICTLAGSPCDESIFVLQPDSLVWVLLDDSVCFTNITVRASAILTAPALRPGPVGGVLNLCATGTVTLEQFSHLTMSFRGWGGGGGGGGVQYCDGSALCKFGRGGTTGADDPNGKSGADGDERNCFNYLPAMVGSGSGGTGGGYGGSPGHNGGFCEDRCPSPPYPMMDSAGGAGGGPFGGAGGTDLGYGNKCAHMECCNDVYGDFNNVDPVRGPDVVAGGGMPGGYAGVDDDGQGCNCDETTDSSILIGSGGGGGAGGGRASGYCCGGADGGPGGVVGGFGRTGCTGGGGGGGGAAGGGAVIVDARDIVVAGEISADGAGAFSLGAGYGAGGGILLSARHRIEFATGGSVRTLGGFSDGSQGSTDNGGTVKLFYRELVGTPAASMTGRLFQQDLSQ